MATVKLARFTTELQSSWDIFIKTWRTSFKLVFLPLFPLLFTLPYLIEFSASIQYNQFPSLTGTTIISFVLFLIGIISFFMLVEIVRTALLIVSANNETNARKVLQIATERFPKFLYTDILSLIYLFVGMLPLSVLIFWTNNGGREILYNTLNPILGGLVLLIMFIIFAAPLFILAVWLSFTQIIVATGKGFGINALTHSTTIVRPIFKDILKRLIIWIIFSLVISYIVSPLPIALWLIPLILNLVGVAFLVVLYKEATGTLTEKVVPATTRAKKVVRRAKV